VGIVAPGVTAWDYFSCNKAQSSNATNDRIGIVLFNLDPINDIYTESKC